jgi:hypothetical protein
MTLNAVVADASRCLVDELGVLDETDFSRTLRGRDIFLPRRNISHIMVVILKTMNSHYTRKRSLLCLSVALGPF